MKIILINVGDIILGPYSAEDIVKNLLAKRFLPIHEVAWPKQRWFRIDKHPQFADICKQISELNLDDENILDLTQSLTASIRTETHTNTSTHVLDKENIIDTLATDMDLTHKMEAQDLGPEEGTRVFFPSKGVLKKSKDLGATKQLKPQSQSQSQSQPQSQPKTIQTQVGAKKIKTFASNQKLNTSCLKTNKFFWIAVGFLVAGFFGFLWQKNTFKKKKQKLNLSIAEQLISKNQFFKSLNLYKKTLNLHTGKILKLPVKVYENYALLLLLVEQDTFEVKKLTSTILNKSINQKRILALSLLFSEDNIKAQNVLLSITNKKPQDLLNLASAYYKQGLYLKSLNTLNLLKKHKQSLLLQSLVYIKLYQKKLDQAWLLKAQKLLKNPLLNFYYKQKTQLIKVYIALLLNKAPQKTDISLILNQDPYLEYDIKPNLFIYSKIWSWESLGNYCQGIVQTANTDLYFKTLNAFCLSKAKNKNHNWSLLLQSLDKSNDTLVGSVLAYIYQQKQLTDKYVVKLAYLTESVKAKNVFLLLSLELRYCVKKQDKKCINNRIADLLSIYPQALFALFQRMQIYKAQGLNKEAQRIQLFLKTRAADYHFL